MTMVHDDADREVGDEEAHALEPMLDSMCERGFLKCVVDCNGQKLYAITEMGKDFFETMEKNSLWPGMPFSWGKA
jgi:DNA-binding PadR family transcriptional regulator